MKKINWNKIRTAPADGLLHTIDGLKYKHFPPTNITVEHILVEDNTGFLWQTIKTPKTKRGWTNPRPVIGRLDNN